MALGSGSRLGPYEILDLLGSGGMGEVYRARDPRLEREVAIKVLPEEIADPARLRRFEQEARAAGALNHPNVLAVYDIGTHEGVPYVVSELLEGETLRIRLAGGTLPVRKALDYALQISLGLAAAHDKGIVHRDLKPENVFVTDDDRVKILDFGLAKLTRPGPLVGEDRGTSTRATEPGTEAGTVLGTVGYMSPEQVQGEAVDARSDIFSFGVVLYEMLSGRRPFRHGTAAETLNAILKEDPPELPWTGGAISPGLARIVQRCLEKRARERFHSAHDLALALEAFSPGPSGSAQVEDSGSDAVLVVGVAKRHKTDLMAGLVAVVLVAAGVYRGGIRSPAPTTGDAIDSVAVLPFENVSGDPDSEYLSDGVAESLINKLSQLPDLKVIARTTSFRFRGDDIDPQQVGSNLDVGAVVIGRVSQRGNTLVIRAEVVDVAQATQLWGERYNAQIGDTFAVEEDIASEISRGLRLKLAPRDETALAKRHTENPEAYRLYLLSRYERGKYTPAAARSALEYARQATEEDPAYAPAYAELAQSYNWLGANSGLPYRETFSRARAAARRALKLDSALPEAHTALAYADWFDFDWAGAERGFERAIELNPNSADAHEWYGRYLAAVGRGSSGGIEHLRRAVELDPLSPGRHFSLYFGYYFDRQYDVARAKLRDALELGPIPGAPFFRAWVHREEETLQEAINDFRRAADDGFSPVQVLGHLGNVYARAGRMEEARKCLKELRELCERDDIGFYEVALIYAGLGDSDLAFEWLSKAYEERDKGLTYLKVDTSLDPLRSDPRFQDLVVRMNFPS